MTETTTNRSTELIEAAQRLAAVFAERAAEHDADSSFPFENFEMLHEAGLLKLTVPVEHGGYGLGIETLCRVTQAIATGDPSTALVMQQHLLQQAGIARLGRWPQEVYEEVVRATVEEGAIINAARVEPEMGTPARGGLPATTATRIEGGWRIDGRKTYTTGAPLLRYAIVWAKTDEEPARVGNFLVPLSSAGVSIDRTWNHLGMRATGSDDLVLDGVEIPEKYAVDVRSQEEWRAGDNVSGPQGSVSMAALYNGVALAARAWLVKYLNERVPTNLGASLATLPRFQATVGEIEALLYTNERLIFTLAKEFEAGRPVTASESGMVKMIATDNVIKVTQLALELTGNPGLPRENELERHYRDALCGRVHTPQTDMVVGAAGRSALGVRWETTVTRILAVIGSVTPPGRLSTAINGAVERATAVGHEVDVIDLGAVQLDFADGRPPADHRDDSARVIEALLGAEAVLLATPVYRGSYTGALKNLLDLLPIEALQSKPVGIVAMGATQHHYLGVDFHPRDVLAWFGALVAPTSVYLASSDFSEGKPSETAAASIDELVATLSTLANATNGAALGPTPFAARRG